MNKIGNFSRKMIYPSLLLCGFCIALPPFFKSISIFILALVLLLGGEFCRCKYPPKQIINISNPLFWLIALYLLYGIGMLWSKDLNYGFNDLTIKLPLLIVPILMMFVPKRFIVKKYLWHYSLAFIAGLVIVLFSCLFEGLSKAISPEGFDSRYIFYSKLSGRFHVTYLSLFCCTALFLIYKIPFKHLFPQLQKYTLLIKVSLFVMLNGFIVLLNARIAFIAMILLLLVLAFDLFVFKKAYLKGALMLSLLVSILFISSNIKNVNQRYGNLEKKMKIEQTSGEKKISDSVSQRTFIYSNIFELINRSWLFGFGTGDSRNALENFYKEHQVSFGRYLNAHNQILQTAIAIGTVGVLCLMAVFVCFIPHFLNKEMFPFLFSLAIIGIVMMTEAILERQSGVHFCAFAFCWFASFFKNREYKKKKNRI